MSAFRTDTIAQLAHELALAPARQREGHLAGAARALEIVHPDRIYPRSFVVFQITGYRSRKNGPDAEIPGRDLIADMVALIETLSLVSPAPVPDAAPPLLEAPDLCRRWQISGKTLARWRPLGLAARWYSQVDGPARLLFAQPDVLRFERVHAERISKVKIYARMTESQRRELARRTLGAMSAGRLTLSAAARAVSAETGRSLEAIRHAVAKFGPGPNESASFDDPCASDDVARWAAPIKYIFAPEFDHPDAQRLIFTDSPDPEPRAPAVAPPPGLPAYLSELYRTPLLSAAQERDGFRRLNFLLHRAEQSRRLLDPDTPSPDSIAHIESLLAQATQVKNGIVQANLRLVVAIARRHLGRVPGMDLYDLVSEGNVALMRAVDGFDVSRGNKFSTYATWAIMRQFTRLMVETCHHRDHFESGHEMLWLFASDQNAADPTDLAPDVSPQAAIREALASLDPREREVVERRFGLARDESQTLSQVSHCLHLSRERIRQIEIKSLAKIRSALVDRGLASQFA